jgi:hypothetical protein
VTVAAVIEPAETVEALRSLLRAWEPRARCPQCGQRYAARPCGPAHAEVRHLVYPPEPS